MTVAVHLERFKIAGFRSCRETEVNLHPQLTVLIGPNGSGKTTILTAIDLLRKMADPIHFYHRGDAGPGSSATMTANFNVGRKRVVMSSQFEAVSNIRNDAIIQGASQTWHSSKGKALETPIFEFAPHERNSAFISRYSIRRRLGRRAASFSLVMPDKEFVRQLRRLYAFLTSIRYYSASRFTDPSRLPAHIELNEGEDSEATARRASSHERFIRELYFEHRSKASKERQSRYQEFIDLVGPSGLKLVDGIEFLEWETENADYSVLPSGKVGVKRAKRLYVIPRFAIGKQRLPPNQLSEGTFRTLALVFYALSRSAGIILIEEPEVCVHHGLLASIVEILKSASTNKQIVISTHSDIVLDHVVPDNVVKVLGSARKGTVAHKLSTSLSSKEMIALREYLRTEGNLGEYWRAGALD